MDTTFREWSSNLAAWVRLVISRLVLIFALPLDFHGRVRVVRCMYLPAALHGIEASILYLLLIASVSLRPLFSGWCGLVVSLWLVLVLSLACWMGLLGMILLYARFGLGFVCFALWPTEVGRVYRFLEMVSEGGPGHGPIHLLSASAAEISIVTWLVLFSISRLLFLMFGGIRLQLISAVGRVFSSLLMSGKEIRPYFGASRLVVFGMVFSL